MDKMSGGTKRLAGQIAQTDKTSGRQNVRRDKTSSGTKTSGDITSAGQNIYGDKTSIRAKRLWGQNVQRENVCLGHVLALLGNFY
jgi:hypothetical protein